VRRPSRSELRGTTVRWLLTVESMGRTWRWSSSPTTITNAATGATYLYDGGLPRVEVLIDADPSKPIAEAQTLTVEVPWRHAAALIEQGHAIRGTAELAWVPEGIDWRDRYVVLVGDLTASAYEESTDPVSVTITPASIEERNEWPPPAYTVNQQSWPATALLGGPVPDDIGRVYPVVFGAPGKFGVTDTASAIYGGLIQFPGSPALRVQSTLTLSAGSDRIFNATDVCIALGRVAAASVDIVYPSGSADGWASETFTVDQTTDSLGRVVSTCDVSGATAGTDITQADVLYVAWSIDYTTPRQSTYGDDGQPITGAGGVVDYLMRRSSVPYDSAAWLGVRSYLDAWSVDTYIDESVGPWTWLADVLLPWLPLSALPGPAGVRPVIWRPDCRRDEAIDHLRAGHDCSRAGVLTVTTSGQSSIAVDYASDADSGDPRQSVALAPEADVGNAVAATAWARTARDLMGADGDETISAPWTAERGTAYAVAAWRTALAAGWLAVDYDVDQDRGTLALGDVVLITDTDVGLTARPAQVGGIIYRDDGVMTLRLVIWRNPAVSSSSVPLPDDPTEPQGN